MSPSKGKKIIEGQSGSKKEKNLITSNRQHQQPSRADDDDDDKKMTLIPRDYEKDLRFLIQLFQICVIRSSNVLTAFRA